MTDTNRRLKLSDFPAWAENWQPIPDSWDKQIDWLRECYVRAVELNDEEEIRGVFSELEKLQLAIMLAITGNSDFDTEENQHTHCTKAMGGDM